MELIEKTQDEALLYIEDSLKNQQIKKNNFNKLLISDLAPSDL